MTFKPTDEQMQAIMRTSGDLFISAGAGSGKTAVLARRFAQAVVEGAAVDDILAITFTRKAAGEVSERVRRVLRYEAGEAQAALGVQHAWVSTIHGFCSRILRRHSLEAGIAPGFRVIDPTESALLQETAFEKASSEMWREPEMRLLLARFGPVSTREIVLKLHARLRSLGVAVEHLPELPEEPLAPRIAHACRALETALRAHSVPPKNATQTANSAAIGFALDALRAVDSLPEESRSSAALEAVSACRLKLTCPATKEEVRAARDALEEVAATVGDQEVARHSRTVRRLLQAFAESYRQAKDAESLLDQDDLQEAVERLFRQRPEVARAYAERFSMIMVDEFQDTNELQLGVIEPLRRDDLCVVGDERQAIYSFRDADVEVFRRMRRTIPHQVALDTNFRSHACVLDFVNAVFASEALFGADYAPLLAVQRDSEDEREPRAEVLLVEREGWPDRGWRPAEAEALAARIAEIVRAGEAEPDDIVILLRAFTNSEPYIRALEAAGLPAVSAGGGAFSSQPEIVQLEALLAVAALPADEESLATLLLGGLVGLEGPALLRLRELAVERGGLWAAVRASQDALPPSDAARVGALQEAVGCLRGESHRRGLGEALSCACESLSVRDRLLAAGQGGERAWANARKLVRMAEAFSAQHGSDPGAFVEHLRALRRLGGIGQAAPRAEGAIRLMTVHAAKGLEFPVVAVADLGRELHDPDDTVFLRTTSSGGLAWALRLPEGQLGTPAHKPAAWQRMHDAEVLRQHAEEKRLLYVACTRAERRLILSGVCKLGEPEDKTPLSWVREALGLQDAVGEPGVRETDGAPWRLTVVRPRDGEAAPLEEETPVVTQPSPALAAPPRLAAATATAPAAAPEERRPSSASHTPLEPPAALSFSSLKLFGACSYRFYAERLLGLRRASMERQPALDFGNALHAAMEALGAQRLRDMAATGPPVSRLHAIARAHTLPEDQLERLSQAVGRVASTEAWTRAAQGERLAHEVPFMIPLGATRLAGAMDLVSWQGADALVVDYKTGTTTPVDALAENYRLQAECYALALLETGLERVRVAFIAAELGGEASELSFTVADVPALRERLERMAVAACAGPYARREEYDAHTCGECAASGSLCPITPPTGRARGAA